MNAKDIIEKSFDKSFNGYKTEDVDEFLREISTEFSQILKEKQDLESKIVVLADKIREYRQDEDALKDALLGAQKQSKVIISEAREKSSVILAEAQEKASGKIKETEELLINNKSEAEQIILNANKERDNIISDAYSQAKVIIDEMNATVANEKKICENLHKESENFRVRLLAEYKKHISLINDFPDKIDIPAEVDTITEKKITAPTTQIQSNSPDSAAPKPVTTPSTPESAAPLAQKAADGTSAAQTSPTSVAESNTREEAKPIATPVDNKITKSIEKRNEGIGETSEIPFQPVFEEEIEDSDEIVDTKNNADQIFVNGERKKSNYEKLEFGNNAIKK